EGAPSPDAGGREAARGERGASEAVVAGSETGAGPASVAAAPAELAAATATAPPGDPAASAGPLVPPAPAAPMEMFAGPWRTETEREILKQQKKFREVEKLRQRLEAGEALDRLQREKVATGEETGRRLFDLHAQRAREQSAELEAEAVLLAQQQQRQVAALQQPQAVFGEDRGPQQPPPAPGEKRDRKRRKAKDQQQQPLPPAGPAAAVLLAELAPPADLATRTARRGRRLRPRGREEAGRRSRPWLRRPRGGPAGPVDAVGADDAAAAAGDAPRAAGPRGAAPAAVPRSGPRPERHGPPAHGAAAAADGRPASRGDRWETCWEYVQTGCCPRGPTCRWEHPPLGPMAFAQGIQFFPGEMKEAAGPPPFLPGNVSPLPLGAGPPLQFQPCGAGPPPAGPGQPGGGDLGERQAPEAARGAAEGAGAEAEAELGGAREED
ncbi:unnamed protein product, partial [Prorocentrum cordatum]